MKEKSIRRRLLLSYYSFIHIFSLTTNHPESSTLRSRFIISQNTYSDQVKNINDIDVSHKSTPLPTHAVGLKPIKDIQPTDIHVVSEAPVKSSLRDNIDQTTVTIENSIKETPEIRKNDVTFTSQGTSIRYHYLPILLRRWTGPLSITFHLKEEEADSFLLRLKEDAFPSRLSIVPYVATNSSIYPINKLRNLAIQNAHTDHIWLTDLDMWPSKGLYEAILALPSAALENEKLAIIIPAYEIHNDKCTSFEECTRATDPIFPETKAELKHCMQIRQCNTFRPWDQLHDYHFREWYNPTYRGNTQEPYVVVKKTEFLPLFDERFVNYAYNKVQWLEHLRYRGYAYSILTDGFAVDVPHPFSALRKKFMDTRKQTQQTLNLELYNQFLAELRSTEMDQSVVKYCEK